VSVSASDGAPIIRRFPFEFTMRHPNSRFSYFYTSMAPGCQATLPVTVTAPSTCLEYAAEWPGACLHVTVAFESPRKKVYSFSRPSARRGIPALPMSRCHQVSLGANTRNRGPGCLPSSAIASHTRPLCLANDPWLLFLVKAALVAGDYFPRHFEPYGQAEEPQ
jgi:hypothetical protein